MKNTIRDPEFFNEKLKEIKARTGKKEFINGFSKMLNDFQKSHEDLLRVHEFSDIESHEVYVRFYKARADVQNYLETNYPVK
jgi:hypothetical protein